MRQVMFRGMRLNDLDHWVTTELSLWGHAAPVYEAGKRVQMDGSWHTTPFHESLSGGLAGVYVGASPDNAQRALRELRRAMLPSEAWLSVETATGWQSIRVFRSGKLDIHWQNEAKIFEWSTQVTADDPSWFRGGQNDQGELDGSGIQTFELGMYRISGGLKFPFRFPLKFPTYSSGGEVSFKVESSARLILDIRGPVKSPELLFTGPDRSYLLKWQGTYLSSGEVLSVEPARKSSVINGSVPRVPAIRQWPVSLGPGYWSIKYTGEEYNSSSQVLVRVLEVI